MKKKKQEWKLTSHTTLLYPRFTRNENETLLLFPMRKHVYTIF